MDNCLLLADTSKLGCKEQYRKGTSEVYAVLTFNHNQMFDRIVFFGLQYVIKKFFERQITKEMIDEFCRVSAIPRTGMSGFNDDLARKRLESLADLGYLPLRIRAVTEGSVVGPGNALMTIVNTAPKFHWLVEFVRPVLMNIYRICMIASVGDRFYRTARDFKNNTCDPCSDHFTKGLVHDYGLLSNLRTDNDGMDRAAHLVNFASSDSVLSNYAVLNFYGQSDAGMNDVSSLFDTANKMLLEPDAAPSKVLFRFDDNFDNDVFRKSLSSRSFDTIVVSVPGKNIYEAVFFISREHKKKINKRRGKVVFLIEDGDPVSILVGDKNSQFIAQSDGLLKLIEEEFGCCVNGMCYKVFNNRIGLVYNGDISHEQYCQILSSMQANCFASSNLVVGADRVLLPENKKGESVFSFETTSITVNDLSVRGRAILFKDSEGNYTTSFGEEQDGYTQNELKTVYFGGAKHLNKRQTLDEIISTKGMFNNK